jgi:hypothetical protein
MAKDVMKKKNNERCSEEEGLRMYVIKKKGEGCDEEEGRKM